MTKWPVQKKQETCRTTRRNSHFLFLCIYYIPVSVVGVSDGSVLLCGEGVWCAWEAWPQPRVLGGQAGGVCRRLPAHHSRTWTQVSSQTLSAATDISTSYLKDPSEMTLGRTKGRKLRYVTTHSIICNGRRNVLSRICRSMGCNFKCSFYILTMHWQVKLCIIFWYQQSTLFLSPNIRAFKFYINACMSCCLYWIQCTHTVSH